MRRSTRGTVPEEVRRTTTQVVLTMNSPIPLLGKAERKGNSSASRGADAGEQGVESFRRVFTCRLTCHGPTARARRAGRAKAKGIHTKLSSRLRTPLRRAWRDFRAGANILATDTWDARRDYV